MRFFHFFRSYCNYFRKRLYIFLKSAYFKTEIEKSLTVQNILMCLLINSNEIITSRNIMKYFRDIGKKLLELSEFHFTVLPTSEYSLLRENEKRTNIFRVLFIFMTHLISSIPEWQKFFLVFSNSSINNYFNFSPSKYFITLFLITNIDIGIPICYKLNAPFLLDNSVEMNLKNFDFFETNIVQDS